MGVDLVKSAFDLALELEVDGKEYYLQQAEAIDDLQLKQLFTMLAEDEEKHYQIIKSMRDRGEYQDLDVDSEAVAAARKIFASRVKSGEIFRVETNYLEAYQHAVNLEKERFQLYSTLAEEATSDGERQLFLKLAKEEDGHRIILENLMEVIGRPETWVESAEFYHLEEY